MKQEKTIIVSKNPQSLGVVAEGVGAVFNGVASLANAATNIINSVSENKRQEKRLKKELEVQDENIKLLRGQQELQRGQIRLQEGQIRGQDMQLEKARFELNEYYEAVKTAKADNQKKQIATAWTPWIGTFVAHEKILKAIGSGFGAFSMLLSRILKPTEEKTKDSQESMGLGYIAPHWNPRLESSPLFPQDRSMMELNPSGHGRRAAFEMVEPPSRMLELEGGGGGVTMHPPRPEPPRNIREQIRQASNSIDTLAQELRNATQIVPANPPTPQNATPQIQPKPTATKKPEKPDGIPTTIKRQIDFVLAQAGRVYGRERKADIPISLKSMLTELVTRNFTNQQQRKQTLKQLEYLKDGTYTLGKIYDTIVAEGEQDKYKRAVQYGLFSINTNGDFSQIDYAPTPDVAPVTIQYTDVAGNITYEQVRDARKNLMATQPRAFDVIQGDINFYTREKDRYQREEKQHSDYAWQRNIWKSIEHKVFASIRQRAILPRGQYNRDQRKADGKTPEEMIRRNQSHWMAFRFIVDKHVEQKLTTEERPHYDFDTAKSWYDGNFLDLGASARTIARWDREIREGERKRDEAKNNKNAAEANLKKALQEKTDAEQYQRKLSNYYGLHKKFFGDSYFYPVFINQEQFERDINDQQLLAVTPFELESGKRARRLYFALHRIAGPLYEQIVEKFKAFKDFSQGLNNAPGLFRNDSEIKQIIKSLLVTDTSVPQKQEVVSTFLNSLEDAVRKSKVHLAFNQNNIPQLVQGLIDDNNTHLAGFLLEFLTNKVLIKHTYAIYRADNNEEQIRGGIKSFADAVNNALKQDYRNNFNSYVTNAIYTEKSGTWGEQFYKVIERLKIANPLGLFNIGDLDFATQFVEYLNGKEAEFSSLNALRGKIETLKKNDWKRNLRQEGLYIVAPTLQTWGINKFKLTTKTYAELLKLTAPPKPVTPTPARPATTVAPAPP